MHFIICIENNNTQKKKEKELSKTRAALTELLTVKKKTM